MSELNQVGAVCEGTGIDPIRGATVGQLIELLSAYPRELQVVMRTYHKADICPVVEVAQIHYETSDITRVEMRMRKVPA